MGRGAAAGGAALDPPRGDGVDPGFFGFFEKSGMWRSPLRFIGSSKKCANQLIQSTASRLLAGRILGDRQEIAVGILERRSDYSPVEYWSNHA